MARGMRAIPDSVARLARGATRPMEATAAGSSRALTASLVAHPAAVPLHLHSHLPPAGPPPSPSPFIACRGATLGAARGFAASAEGLAVRPAEASALDTFLPVKTLPEEQGTRRNLPVVVRNMEGDVVGSTTLLGDVFDLPIRADVVHEVVVWQLAARRQGTHKTKGRGEVNRTGRKPHPQKGTGRARAGDLKAPQHSGGGHAHPIRPRDYSYKINKKVMRLGLCCALSARAAEGALMVVDKLDLSEPRTGEVNRQLQALLQDKDYDRVLVVDRFEDGEEFQKFVRATNNIPKVEALSAKALNVYSILHRKKLILTVGALEELTYWLTKPIVRIKSD